MENRIEYLDNIRIFLISYVIAGHVSVAYGAIGGGNWYYIEPAQDFYTKAILYLFDMFAYSFLMAMFIFIAGYFTPASLERRGSYGFLRTRFSRLFLPMVIYYFLIGPLVRYISMLAKGYEGGYLNFLSEMYQSGVYGYLGVMWFVALLLVFSIVYAGYRRIWPEGIFQLRSSNFPSNVSILFFIILIGFLSFLSRVLFPMGGGYLAARPLASIVLFAAAFFLGTVAWKYQWLEKLTNRKAWLWFWIALAFMIAPLILFVAFRANLGPGAIKGAGSVASMIYSFWEVVKSVGTGMMAVVLFRRYFNNQGKVAKALGRSAFAAYVIHPVVCVILMYWLSFHDFHGLIKFAIVAPVAIILTFGLAWVLTRIPGINKLI